jgi:hypothetical protein
MFEPETVNAIAKLSALFSLLKTNFKDFLS